MRCLQSYESSSILWALFLVVFVMKRMCFLPSFINTLHIYKNSGQWLAEKNKHSSCYKPGHGTLQTWDKTFCVNNIYYLLWTCCNQLVAVEDGKNTKLDLSIFRTIWNWHFSLGWNIFWCKTWNNFVNVNSFETGNLLLVLHLALCSKCIQFVRRC